MSGLDHHAPPFSQAVSRSRRGSVVTETVVEVAVAEPFGFAGR